MVRGRATFVDIVSQDCNELLAQFGRLAFAGARILRRSGGLQEDKELRVIDMMDTTVTRMSGLIDNVCSISRAAGWAAASPLVAMPIDHCCRSWIR
jgi:sigma-B regulation protein RsbU (phosphoserine phosphatase)